jgi:NCAIR mutase (PurE)-related protein
LPLVSLLKNASLKSAEDKRQLVTAKNSNIDIENFVDNMETWKTGWSNNMKNAGKKHSEAIDQINKAIKDLEKVREALTMSDKHLLAAENKMDDLTIKRLTKNSPSVAEKFKELEGQ